MIFATAFNITSDIMLLCIPVPIVIQSRIPLKRQVAPVSIVIQGLTMLQKDYSLLCVGSRVSQCLSLLLRSLGQC